MTIRLTRAPVTMAIMIAIIVVFGIEIATNALDEGSDMIVTLGAIIPGIFERHDYWRLLTAMFLHGGFLHVSVNLWSIYQLGMLYEVMFGSARFAFIYFATGIAASITSALHVNGASVGASGAVFGLLGAFIFSILRSPKWRHEKWTRGLIKQLIFWAVLNLAIGQFVPLIDNSAHIGGLVAGLILGFLPHRVPPPPPSQMVIETQSQQGGPA
jgi:rhomboid protease GluP